jgi:pimeloyl-ACP methyl ester carboxylesterase
MAPWLHEVKAPALVLTAEHDGGCPPRLNVQIAKALPGSELVVLPGLRHAILLEAADRVADHMAAFLARH